MTTPTNKNTPDAEHPSVDRMRKRWQRCRDLVSGTDAVHAAGEKYLPKHPAEEHADYERRAKATEVYNGFSRTVTAMVGLVFQMDPTLGDDVPKAIKDAWEDIDGRGTHGSVFAKRLFADGLTTGLAGILVDYPVVEQPDTVSKADEAALGLRPYWVPIKVEQYVSSRHAKVGGTIVMTQLVLKEEVEEADGEFGTKCVTRYRVFKRGEGVGAVTWQLWEEKNESGAKRVEMISSGTLTNATRITFAPFLAGPVEGDMETRPPLLDLADVNLAHYRVQADRRHVMHLACVPIPVRIGAPQGPGGTTQPIGPNLMIDIPIGGDFKWASPDGGAFQPTREELQDLERRMASLEGSRSS
jgi:hypothetical protein